MTGGEWRVEVELDDERHGYSLGERLRALDLDDEARKRLGRRVIVTRDGSQLFLYTSTRAEADEAARVVQELAGAEELTADIRTTRWHPDEEAWRDADEPLPRTEAERAEEREARTGHDWHVHVHAPAHSDAVALERRLREEGVTVERRWRYLTVDAVGEDEANGLAARIRTELPEADVEVEPSGLPDPLFVMIGSWL